MTKDGALKLALLTLNEVRSETFRLMRNGQTLYAEAKVWSTIFAIKEVLAQRKETEQELVAWVYPEGLDALKAGKPWTAYGTRQDPNNTALYLSPQKEEKNR